MRNILGFQKRGEDWYQILRPGLNKNPKIKHTVTLKGCKDHIILYLGLLYVTTRFYPLIFFILTLISRKFKYYDSFSSIMTQVIPPPFQRNQFVTELGENDERKYNPFIAHGLWTFPANKYMLKFINPNNRKTCEICSKLTI